MYRSRHPASQIQQTSTYRVNTTGSHRGFSLHSSFTLNSPTQTNRQGTRQTHAAQQYQRHYSLVSARTQPAHPLATSLTQIPPRSSTSPHSPQHRPSRYSSTYSSSHSPMASHPHHDILSRAFIYTDLDGTILPSKQQLIPHGNIRAFLRAGEMQMTRVLITGRNLHSAREIVDRSLKQYLEGQQQHLHGSKHAHHNDNNQKNDRCRSHDPNDNQHDHPVSIFDYIITSSGAAIADGATYELLRTQHIPAQIAAVCVDYLRDQGHSFFLQHRIPYAHFHHHYACEWQGGGSGSGVAGDGHDTHSANHHRSGSTLNDLEQMIANNTITTTTTTTTIQLPASFCVRSYNHQLPTDFTKRCRMTANSFPLRVDCEDYVVSEATTATSRPTTLEHLCASDALRDGVSQLLVPVHPKSLLPIGSTEEEELNVSSSSHRGGDTAAAPEANPTHNGIRVHSSCACCAGAYMLHDNPVSLVRHFEQNVLRYLASLQPTEDTGETVRPTTLSIVHATSPLDHATIWLEIFPPGVNKAFASEAVLSMAAQAQAHTDVHSPPSTHPSMLLAFGNDYNDFPMLSWVQGYSHASLSSLPASTMSPAPLLQRGFLVTHPSAEVVKHAAVEHGFQLIGTAAESSVGGVLDCVIDQVLAQPTSPVPLLRL